MFIFSGKVIFSMKGSTDKAGRKKRLEGLEFIVNNINHIPLHELAEKLGITEKSLKGYFSGIRWLLLKKPETFMPHIKGEARKTKILLFMPGKISPKRIRHFLTNRRKRRL